MPLTLAVNQKAFDEQKAREKICMQWLKTLVRPVRKTVFYAALAGIGGGLGVIAQAALLAFILHQLIIEHQSARDLMKPMLIFVLVFSFRSLCIYGQQVWGFQAAANIKRDVRQLLSDKIVRLGPAYLKHRQSGELATLSLEQVEALEGYFARYLPQQMISGVLPIFIIAAVMPVNWVVGLIFLVTGPLVPIFMVLIGMGAASAHRDQFIALARMGGYFLDRLQGLPTLKLFGRAESEVHSIREMAVEFRKRTMTVLRIAFLSSAVLEFFSAVAIGLVAVYVGLGLLGLIEFGGADEISLQQALFMLLLAPEFHTPLRQLAIHYHERAEALGAADHLLTVLGQDDSDFICRADEPKITAFLIECCDVWKVYGQRQVLSAISVEIKAGEKIALVGESGAGKTTLLNLMLGFEAVSQGRVFLDGQSVTREIAARYCAWVGQQTHIFVGSIRDNIALFDPAATVPAVSIAAAAAGVDEFSDRLPEGLETQVGERGYGLSGGQVQRIALARAFLKPVPIVLLDEPTANLDSLNKGRLLDTIETLFKDRTVIIASHDRDVIDRMDRCIHLVNGSIQA
ncbi:MAG: thiol reductant ABC exporter subunit CydD [Gammaproteobacteria bacterium]